MSGYSRISLAFCIGVCLLATPTPAAASDASRTGYIELYRALLVEFTQETESTVQTLVNYRGLLREPRWKQLIAKLKRTNPATLSTREQRLAYWINVYNIFAIDLVLGSYPLDSIKDIDSFFSPVWNTDAGTIGGRVYSLGEIEHKILRTMGEPRIHAAIVCASVSCPPLARTPFEAALLEQQLEANFKRWLSSPTKGMRLDRAGKTLHLSQVFDWFESDFETLGGVMSFVQRYLEPEDAGWLKRHRADVDIEYLDYDWGLNE